MGLENCDIPDNSLNGLFIELPEGLKDGIISDTELELSQCFIESLGISGGSETVIELTKQVFIVLGGRQVYKEGSFGSELISKVIAGVLNIIKTSHTSEYIRLYKNQSDAFISINFQRIEFGNDLSLEFLSPSEVNGLYQEGILTSEEAFLILEGNEGFQEDKNMILGDYNLERGYNLSDGLEDYGFSEDFLNSMREITGRNMNKQEQDRLLLMIQFFLKIESRGGYNITHDTGETSAEGVMQYVYKNGKLDITRNESNEVVGLEWLTNSFETGLRVLPESILSRHEGLLLAEQSSNIYLTQGENESISDFESRLKVNQSMQSPLSLSSQEQLILTLNDLFSRNSTSDEFVDIFDGSIQDAQEAIINLYIWEHHKGILTPAGIDSNTQGLITRTAIDKFSYPKTTVLFSPRPQVKPDNLGQVPNATSVVRPRIRPNTSSN